MTSITFGGTNSAIQVGIMNGTIQLPPERPETPPPPLSTVPFCRDPDFVDRGILLDQIQEKGSTQGARIALVGIGGVGKTQLAIEYCHRIQDQSPDTWILWIHASNATRFEQSCREIAERAKIRGRQDPQVNIFPLLHDWLNAKTEKWVLVLDNLDDDKFLHAIPSTQSSLVNHDSGVPERSTWSYLYQNSRGCIVMTSRSRDVALRIVEDYNILTVEPMNETDAVSLFEKKIGAQNNRSAIIQLATALDFMPLAIVQAASFIKRKAPKETVTTYLERFEKSDRQKIKLLEHEGGQLRRDPESTNAILLTWQISFEHIQERRSSAAGLLSLMSFFDRQGIPDSLLREGRTANMADKASNTSDTEDDESIYSEIDMFEDDKLLLKDYSLISVSSDQTSFTMHRLVQLGTQEWLQARGKLEQWKEIFILKLDINFPEGHFEHWKECQLLFPHVQCTLMQKPVGKASMRDWASLLHKAASFALTSGNSVDCKRMAKRAMTARQDLFGLKHEEAMSSSNMLSLAYVMEGQWKKAEELQLQVMESRRQVLGPEHPDTLTSMSNLAKVYQDQGKWKEAEELELQVMETRMQVFGPEHPSTLTSMNNLALTYWDQGRWKKAEELELKVIETRKQVLGPEHPSTLTSMANLASTYRDQGRWKEAEELQAEELQLSSKTLGPEHPSTLTSMNNLGAIYRNQGRWKEAEELHTEELKLSSKALGPEHHSTLTSMANLASIYRDQGRWKEAEELQAKELKLCSKAFGPEHSHTLTSMNNLGAMYRDQGRWKEAEELHAEEVKLCSKALGPVHPSTLVSMNNLAIVYWNQERWKEAEELEVQVMETRKQVLGPEHPSTLTSMANLASTYQDQGRWKEAEELQAEELKLCSEALGPEHPFTLTSMNNLAFTLRSLGKNEAALQMIAECAEYRSKFLGPDHPSTISSVFTCKEWQSLG